jgi:hypothetical protein
MSDGVELDVQANPTSPIAAINARIESSRGWALLRAAPCLDPAEKRALID